LCCFAVYKKNFVVVVVVVVFVVFVFVYDSSDGRADNDDDNNDDDDEHGDTLSVAGVVDVFVPATAVDHLPYKIKN